MTVGPFTRKTDLVDLVRAQDINELQIACEDLQAQLGTFSAYGRLQTEGKIGWVGDRLPLTAYARFEGFMFTMNASLDFTSLPSGWTWAGSPFVTPTYSIVNGSWLKVQPGANNRAFLVAPGTPTATPKIIGGIFMHAGADTTYMSLRLDDGTDNNYVELTIAAHPTSIDQMRFLSRIRTGGGTVTESVLYTTDRKFHQFLEYNITGSPWSSWGLWVDTYAPMLYATVGTSQVSFTPSRVGLVFYVPDIWQFVAVDALGGTWP